MNTTIRLAIPADALDMAEVYMRSWEAAYKDIVPADYISEKNKRSFAQMEHLLNDEKFSPFQYVMLLDGVIVGIMTVASSRDEDTDDSFYELHGIYLHPDYYRKGIGTQAMEFACNIAHSLDKITMILWVFEDNINSVKFYEKCGFAADGKTKILYCGKELTAIRMRKNLLA